MRGVGQLEAAQELVDSIPDVRGRQLRELPDQAKVLVAREVGVDGGALTRQSDPAADGRG